MATIRLPPDFKEFLRSLNSSEARYLVVGGYAVNYYGFIRTTGDLDIWIDPEAGNAARVTLMLQKFGFPQASKAALQEPNKIFRLGVPPLRVEIMTSISGVSFESCYARRVSAVFDDVGVTLIHLDDLKQNKSTSGRLKDRLDLEQLP